MSLLETKCLSSLSKVFPDTEITDTPFSKASVLCGESFSFQVAYRAEKLVKRLHVHIDTDSLELPITVRSVGLVPSELPCYNDHDDYILRDTPGLYPDPLYPLSPQDEIYAYPGQWRSIWITANIPTNFISGVCQIKITISGEDDSLFGYHQKWYGEEIFQLKILPCLLPKQNIIHTEWFYTDCISTWYDVEPFTSPYWDLVDKYMYNAAVHGINMLLTPVFTPPLETKINNYRSTIQLIDIKKEGEIYSFDFSKLETWIQLCKKNHIEYIEISHLFTQWGAYHAPKIIVTGSNCTKQLFGWETNAHDTDYLDFLHQFLPALTFYLNSSSMRGHVFFHISDEPGVDRLEEYSKLCKTVKNLIGDYPLLDALSDFELFQQSNLTIAVPATDEIYPFIENNTENLWAYYACLQYKNSVSNRFFHLPSCRNRILGIQLYKFGMKGFLHWGYNHWYSGLSEKKINPYITTDADACFPSGDAFLVYPGEKGPINSIRIEVLHEAFQDYRALELLESLIGKEKVLTLLEEEIQPVTFHQYPHDLQWLLTTREKINEYIFKEF